LQERRSQEAGLADNRIVRRDDDVVARDPVLAGDDRERIVFDVVHVRVLEDRGTVSIYRGNESLEISQRVNARLAWKFNGRHVDERRAIHEGRVESEIGSDLGLCLQPLDVLALDRLT